MSENRFGDRVDAVEYLSEEISTRLGIELAVASAIAEASVDLFSVEVTGATDMGTRRAIIRPLRWVIRTQDLGLVDLISGLLQGTTTGAAVYFTAGSAHTGLVAPAVAIFVQVFKGAVALRKNGVQLSEADFRLLLLIVDAQSGITTQAIFESKDVRSQCADLAELEKSLEHLSKYPTVSGDIALIWKGADGRWHPKDL